MIANHNVKPGSVQRLVRSTPRTDAKEIEACHLNEQGGGWLQVVPSSFARELETELNAALVENARLHGIAKELDAAKHVIEDDIKLINELKANAPNDQAERRRP
jgi:hypothetical protein